MLGDCLCVFMNSKASRRRIGEFRMQRAPEGPKAKAAGSLARLLGGGRQAWLLGVPG